ncbi:MAG: 2-iminoacetate synthase ThiH [Candidatus Hydrogenedentes bacterium]|nr:2-iminoacetate synthase ThiH [Candidatus Hydrogenedentota bacterium]
MTDDGGVESKLAEWPGDRVQALIARAAPGDVESAIRRASSGGELSAADLAALLSPAARGSLETMAREAQRLTRRHFGRTITLYAPIYLSNVCAADCLYCGFAAKSGDSHQRLTLDPPGLRVECEALAAQGFQTLLLVTGEAPSVVTVDYLAESVEIAREYFPSVSVEVYSMTQPEYEKLVGRGLEGVTLYMETYDRPCYAKVHPKGRKQDYAARLESLDRAGADGARKLNLWVLLGLFDWRLDGFWLGLHARHLQKQWWRSAVAVSFPRLRHVPARFTIPAPVGDSDLVQLMLGLRLFLPQAGFTLSTRENAGLRDRLIPLGVTHLSAGSSTRPGGYALCGSETLEQFAIEDRRSPSEVARAVAAAGYDPVWKDFDRAFTGF